MLKVSWGKWMQSEFHDICCDPSLQPSWRDGSNEGSQRMFIWRNMGNYP